MRPAKIADEAVADALVSAFRRDGYTGAAIRDLCGATGLKSASLYHRFPRGKTDMALAAQAWAAEGFGEAVVPPLGAEGDPAARLRKSAAGLRRYHAGGRLACLPPRRRHRSRCGRGIAAVLARWRDAVAALLAEAGPRAGRGSRGPHRRRPRRARARARHRLDRRAVSRMEGLPPSRTATTRPPSPPRP
jgi:TetR/AcrR family transcriptional repressor of lmrAB and yxaGH operons